MREVRLYGRRFEIARVRHGTRRDSGDSGGPVLDEDGKALGILSTVMLAPNPGSNEVTDVSRALAYANQHTAFEFGLVPGTEGFRAQ